MLHTTISVSRQQPPTKVNCTFYCNLNPIMYYQYHTSVLTAEPSGEREFRIKSILYPFYLSHPRHTANIRCNEQSLQLIAATIVTAWNLANSSQLQTYTYVRYLWLQLEEVAINDELQLEAACEVTYVHCNFVFVSFYRFSIDFFASH